VGFDLSVSFEQVPLYESWGGADGGAKAVAVSRADELEQGQASVERPVECKADIPTSVPAARTSTTASSVPPASEAPVDVVRPRLRMSVNNNVGLRRGTSDSDVVVQGSSAPTGEMGEDPDLSRFVEMQKQLNQKIEALRMGMAVQGR